MKNTINNVDYSINDIITTDGYIKICEDNYNDLSHIKTDYFYCGKFSWRGEQHPKEIKKNVIISHSDYCVDEKISSQFNFVFCVNNNSKSINTFSLPLGIPNDCDDLPILKIIGNKDSLIQISKEKHDKSHLAYLNFSSNTNLKTRSNIFNTYHDKIWVKLGNMDYSMDGRINYFRDIKKSKFVFCPMGNGFDTHRLWETLYLGSIPIIENFKTHDICYDLPVLFINDWGSLSENFLNEKYYEIINKKYNMEKLKISYWKKQIENKINTYV